MSREEMLARIAALEAQLVRPERVHRTPNKASAADRAHNKRVKAETTARRKQFKIDAWRRAHRHTSLNRYYF